MIHVFEMIEGTDLVHTARVEKEQRRMLNSLYLYCGPSLDDGFLDCFVDEVVGRNPRKYVPY